MDPKLKAFATSLLDDDKKTRLKKWLLRPDVRKLKAFVSTESDTFEKADYFKLWEALFFALWTADSPTLQRQLGCDFCQLIRHVPKERVETWMDAFWFVLQREWDKLDRYRIDKFHLYLRMFLAESFRWVKKQNWDSKAVEALTSSWTLGPLKILRPGETYSFGVAYHLVEALMEELNHERKDDANFTSRTFFQIISPFLKEFCYSSDKILAKKIQDHVLLSINPNVEGELESVGEWLFERTAIGTTDAKCQIRVQRVYQAIQGIDTVLASVGRRANYEAVIERVKSQLPSRSMSVEEMAEQSKKAEKARKMEDRSKKVKKKLPRKVVTKVFTTRRKKIIKKRRVV